MAPRRAAALHRHGLDAHAKLRDHLVAMTGELLGDEPLATLTTRRIARHAGVSDGVLYNHFADKEELVVAAASRHYAALLDGFDGQAPVAGQGTVEANLTAYARHLSELLGGAMHMGAGLMADPELLKRFWLEIHTVPLGPYRLLQPLAGYLEAERAAGRLRRTLDVGAATSLIMGACALIAFTRHLNPEADGSMLDAHLDATIGTLLRGAA